MNRSRLNNSSFWFTLVAAVLIIASVVSFDLITRLDKSARWVNHTQIVKNKLVEALSDLKDAETNQRGYLLTFDTSLLRPYLDMKAYISPVMKDLDSLVSDNPLQQAELMKLKTLIAERTALLHKSVDIWEKEHSAIKLTASVLRGKAKMDEVRAQVARMIATENKLLEERVRSNKINSKITPLFSLFVTMLCIIALTISFAKTRKESSLRRSTNQLLIQKNRDLQEQQDFVDAIFNASVDVMIVLDRDLVVTKFNKAGSEAYGPNGAAMVGKRMPDMYPHIVETGLYADLKKALKGEKIHTQEYFSPTTHKYSELFLIPLKDREGEVNAVLMVAHDISAIIESNRLLQEQNQELEQTNQELASFSYIASHDLKEPLRKIQIFSQRIVDTETFTDKAKDLFARIISASTRMQNLIDSLLNFSRANKNVTEYAVCDMNDTVAEAIHYLEDQINERNALVEVGRLPVINGVNVQLVQLFINLIDNGIKYTLKTVRPHIKITCITVNGKDINVPFANTLKEYYRIDIADNGIGFEEQYKSKIFEIFQRLHGRHEYSGTGIGLAICKKIAANHHGFILAEGESGQGAIFSVYFLKEETKISATVT